MVAHNRGRRVRGGNGGKSESKLLTKPNRSLTARISGPESSASSRVPLRLRVSIHRRYTREHFGSRPRCGTGKRVNLTRRRRGTRRSPRKGRNGLFQVSPGVVHLCRNSVVTSHATGAGVTMCGRCPKKRISEMPVSLALCRIPAQSRSFDRHFLRFDHFRVAPSATCILPP